MNRVELQVLILVSRIPCTDDAWWHEPGTRRETARGDRDESDRGNYVVGRPHRLSP